MSIHTSRSSPGCPATVLVIAGMLAGCGNNATGEAVSGPPPSLMPGPSGQPAAPPRPTPFVLGPLIDEGIDLYAGPVQVPLEVQIPALKVNAPVLGVGLTSTDVMASPKGPIGDPIWHTAFWYRGGGIPGDVGTATIAGHVDDPLGAPEIFARLGDLHPVT